LYLKELKNSNSTQEETFELIKKYQETGDFAARDKVIKNYLLHVVKIANTFSHKDIDVKDMIEEGTIGLIIAIDKYDLDNGSTFGSYSKYWIRQAIIRNCINKRRIIRLPENITNAMTKGEWKGIEYNEVSYDNEEINLQEKIAAQEDDIFNEEEMITKTKINRMLSLLKERDCDIVKDLFGIGIEDALAVEEVAEKYDITTTRVNQIQRASLDVIRKSQIKINSNINIVSALYGINECSIDVTDIIAKKYSLCETIKVCNSLSGDPCPGKKKKLMLSYVEDNRTIKREFIEGSYICL